MRIACREISMPALASAIGAAQRTETRLTISMLTRLYDKLSGAWTDHAVLDCVDHYKGIRPELHRTEIPAGVLATLDATFGFKGEPSDVGAFSRNLMASLKAASDD
jgi:hypothetical protein